MQVNHTTTGLPIEDDITEKLVQRCEKADVLELTMCEPGVDSLLEAILRGDVDQVRLLAQKEDSKSIRSRIAESCPEAAKLLFSDEVD